MKKAILKDEHGYAIATYEIYNNSGASVRGVIKRVISWDGDKSIPLEDEMFAEVVVKWDGCSHFSFYGQDYPVDKDSYYHVCGITDYLDFMRIMHFAYEVMVRHVGFDQIDEKEELRDLRKLGLLKGYKIEVNK